MANISSINGNPIVVGTSGMSDNAVTTAKIKDGAVTADKLDSGVHFDPADGSISTSKLASGAVTDSKLAQNGVVDTMQANLGNIIALSDGYITTNTSIGSAVSLIPQASDTLRYAVVSCSEGDIFTVYGTGESAGRLWAFIDSDNLMLKRAQANETQDGKQLRAPANAAKFIVNTNRCAFYGSTIWMLNSRYDEALNVNGLSYKKDTYVRHDGTELASAARYCTEFVPCSANKPVTYVGETGHAQVAGISFYNIKKTLIQSYCNNAANGTPVTVTSPAGTAYCRVSTNEATLQATYVNIPNGSLSDVMSTIAGTSGDTLYVSPDGSDSTGDGSSSNPFLTVNKALSSGASRVVAKSGVYRQVIDLSTAINCDVSIVSGDTTGRAVFVHPDSLLSETESKLSGYDDVYYFAYSGDIQYSDIRLYQDGVADASTLISDSERSPYERGQEYRCLDTKIVCCTSDSLSDALGEIDGSSEYKYYYDTDNDTIYYSRPQAVSSAHPIMRSIHTGNLLTNKDRSHRVSLYGIECKYMRFDVSGTVAYLEDCKSTNSFGAGGFVYDSSLSATFVRCEACGTYYTNGAGDGFNAHSSKTGDPLAKQTTAMQVDCWSHDCQDDGYSDHERSETEIWGGLYEYNGKAGVTPSYGSHCSCYNVMSRNNYSGFLYLGEATQDEGGKYGQMLCVGCVAENNVEQSSGYGFAVKGSGNTAKLVGCKSIGNLVGYYCAGNTAMELVDCGGLDNTTPKVASGTLSVKNTTLVTAD